MLGVKKIIIYLLMFLISSMLYAESTVDCKIHVYVSQKDKKGVVLRFSYDDSCEIVMDQNNSQVIIRQKSDSNITADANVTMDINTTKSIIDLAKSKLGASYEVAKAGPNSFDCSGFLYYVYRSNDIKIPRTSLSQSKIGEKLTREQLEVGDLLFFDTYDRKHVNHSGIYLGDGKFIHATSGKAYSVTISELDKGFYKDKFRWGVRKPPKEK